MRRTVMLGVMVSFLLCSLSMAGAEQFCWRLQDGATPPNNLIDFIRASVDLNPHGTNPPIFRIGGVSHEAPPLYHLVGSGSATPNKLTPLTSFRLEYTAGHDTTFFGGNRSCTLTAIINGTFNGTWEMQCAGTTMFNVSGHIVFEECDPIFLASFGMAPLDVHAQQQEVIAAQTQTFGEVLAAGIGNFKTLEK